MFFEGEMLTPSFPTLVKNNFSVRRIMMEEIWKTIEDSDGHYFISNFGRLRREPYELQDSLGKHLVRKEKIMEQGNFNKKNGYYSYCYRGLDGSPKKNYVHRIVAFHFVNNSKPLEYNQINHIDGDKSNNHADNLGWVNTKLNMEHASKHNLINRDSEKRKSQAPINGRIGAEKTAQDWCKYSKDGDLIEITKGGNGQWVSRLTYKGYTWRRAEELIKQYGEVPKHLDVSHSFSVASRRRKIFFAHLPNGECVRYETIESLPISREKLWYAYNHKIADDNGAVWEIKDAEKGEVDYIREYKTLKVSGYDECGNLKVTFDSLFECLKYLGVKGSGGMNNCIKKNRPYHGYYWRKEE